MAVEEKKEAQQILLPPEDDFLLPQEEKVPCMKCGREMPVGQAFCDQCLADMAQYPVDPEIPVIIPTQPAAAPNRRQKQRRERKPEEQNRILRKMVLWISLVALLITVVGGAAIALLTGRLQELQTRLPQHNNTYSTNEQLTTR